MTQPRPIRTAMIVDDHPLYSEALAATVELITGANRIEIAETLFEAEQLLSNRFNPRIVFLDLNLPDVTGLEGFMSIIQKLPETPVVVISATTAPEVIRLVKNSGAAGYIPKNLPRDALKSAIEGILEGVYCFPEIYEEEASTTNSSQKTTDLEDMSRKLARLTRQQTRILDMICEGKLNKQIAYELDLAEATVKTHITAMMRKLGVRNRTQAALLVRDARAAAKLE